MAGNTLNWQDGNTPKSEIFDDIYFSTEDGLAESRAVFLNGIAAPEIWQNKSEFTICELGFGSGLNFLATVKLWLDHAAKEQRLIYIATEKYPLDQDDIRRAVHWPELADIRDVFLENYHNDNISLFEGRISLRLLKGDSLEQLTSVNFKADGWYLDGFAPGKNPEMWCDGIYAQMARLSNGRARVATFTAAGFVRRGLENAGFSITKRPGFGRKREMLAGTFGD